MTQRATRMLSTMLAGAVALATFSLYTFQASANYERGGQDGDSTSIHTENFASVTNNVSVDAKTGGNDAEGGDGGRGGDGGNASRGTGGAGGNGGRGGDGGSVVSGAATAYGTIYNDVNSTRVVVEGCGCEDDQPASNFNRFMYFNQDEDGDMIRVSTRNTAYLTNNLDVDAKTGNNDADGGEGGNGDDGGNAGDQHGKRSSKQSWNLWFDWYNTSNGGNGGNGGVGGNGGTVRSGAAYADGLVNSVVNNSVVRVTRGAADES